jgi:predicted  nucleic acid-binding Zn-ribbon protein
VRKSGNPVPKPHGQIELREPTSRVIALMREREKLLTKITRKKRSLDKEVASIKELQVHVARAQDGMRPLMEQVQKVEQEIHQLFATLLAKGRLKVKERRLVREVYDELQSGGTISPARDTIDEDVLDWLQDDPEPDSHDEHHPSPGSPDSVAAAKRPAAKSASSLRDIFRRLAVAIHPDRSQTDEDRHHRTEAMKEVTRAYQDGDLARLLELENAWLAEEKTPVATHDETERRCANLERTNHELKKQLRELESELRELKNSLPVLAADHLGLRGKHSATRVEDLIAETKVGIDGLGELRDFVRSFVDGKITLDQFMVGPDGGARSAEEDDHDDMDLADLDAFLDDIFGQVGRTPKRRSGRRQSRR